MGGRYGGLGQPAAGPALSPSLPQSTANLLGEFFAASAQQQAYRSSMEEFGDLFRRPFRPPEPSPPSVPSAGSVSAFAARAAARRAAMIVQRFSAPYRAAQLALQLADLAEWANVNAPGWETVCVSGAALAYRCVVYVGPQCETSQPNLGDTVGSPSDCLLSENATGCLGLGPHPNPDWFTVKQTLRRTPTSVRALLDPATFALPTSYPDPRPYGARETLPVLLGGPPAGREPGGARPPTPRTELWPQAGPIPPEPPFLPPTRWRPGRDQKPKNYARLKAVINAATEAKDLFECIWESLPKECKSKVPKARFYDPDKPNSKKKSGKGGWVTISPKNDRGKPITKPRPADMAKDLMKCAGQLSSQGIVHECLGEMLKDAVIGTLAKGAAKASYPYIKGRPFGFQAGPVM